MNTYNPTELRSSKRKGGWKKGLLIFILIFAFIVLLCVGCNLAFKSKLAEWGIVGNGNDASNYEYSEKYIGVLNINGTITESIDSSGQYNQKWLISRVNQMKNDANNKGIILRINTPGGSVYATDELYLKLKEYSDVTKRPIYTYMESMAASGGYYISCASDKIFANRNCWTGSIGVTIGTVYDISGFLKKMGVKTVTITSGRNKAMGSYVDPMTKEQKRIFQGLVDDAYTQFTEIVSQGRGMPLEKVIKLADGRIYTANQAKSNGLIDDVLTFNEAVDSMKTECHLENCAVEEICYEPEVSLRDLLLGTASGSNTSSQTPKNQYEELKALMEENNTFTLSYMSYIRQ